MCSRKQARLVIWELPCLGKLVCMYRSCFKFPAACPYQNQTWVTSPQMMAALLSVVIWMRCQISQDPTSVQNVLSPKCRFPTSGGLLIWKIKRYIKERTLSVQIWKTCCHGQSENNHIVSPNLNNRLSVKKRRRRRKKSANKKKHFFSQIQTNGMF